MDSRKHKCMICSKRFDSDKSLHFHLKAHSIKTKEYYEKFFPKKDLLTGEKIEFTNKESYKKKHFVSATNFKTWRKITDINEVRKFCSKLFNDRVKDGKVRFSLSEVELRSLMWPTVSECEKLFDGYYDFCSSVGLINKFKYYLDVERPAEDNDFTIYIDTREQLPLEFGSKDTEVRTLKFGDYCASNAYEKCLLYIERKSLADFVGTLSPKHFNRFRNEIMKAADSQAFLVVLVESVFSNAMSFKKQREVRSKERIHKDTKMNPGYILKQMRDLCQEFSHIQFLFVDGREESSRVAQKVFANPDYYSKIDLQYMYDISNL